MTKEAKLIAIFFLSLKIVHCYLFCRIFFACLFLHSVQFFFVGFRRLFAARCLYDLMRMRWIVMRTQRVIGQRAKKKKNIRNLNWFCRHQASIKTASCMTLPNINAFFLQMKFMFFSKKVSSFLQFCGIVYFFSNFVFGVFCLLFSRSTT